MVHKDRRNESGEQGGSKRSWIRSNLALVAVATIVALAAVGTFGVAALTPDHALPVGTGIADGDSMGHDEAQFVLYADVEPSVGDQIVWEYDDGRYAHHRIVGADENGYLTKGDANGWVDQEDAGWKYDHATDENIRGVVVMTTPVWHAIGGAAALLAVVALLGVTLHRRDVRNSVQKARRAVSGVEGAAGRVRAILTRLRPVAFALVIVASLVATPFMGGVPIGSDHNGVVSANDWTTEGSYGGHSSTIKTLTAGPDGYLYSGSDDDQVHKIDPSDMSQVATYTGHSGSVSVAEMGPDGYLYTASGTSLHKIDPSDMSRVDSYSGHSTSVKSITFGDDGSVYTSGGEEVHKHDPSDMSVLGKYTGQSTDATASAFGSDGYLYSGNLNGNVHKVDPSDMSQVDTYSGHSDKISYMSTDGEGSLFTAGVDDDVHKINTLDMSQEGVYSGHTGTVHELDVGDDGFLYTASDDEAVHRVNTSNLAREDTYTANNNNVFAVEADADGFVYSGGWNYEVLKSDPGTSVGVLVSGQVTDAETGDPLSHAEVSVDGETFQTDDNGVWEAQLAEDTYDFTAEARGYFSETKTETVEGETTVDFQLTATDEPYVGDISPDDGEYADSTTVPIEAQLHHPDGDDMDYAVYTRRVGEGDSFTERASGIAADGEVVSNEIAAGGEIEWYVELDDGSDVIESDRFRFTAPGSLTFYDYETEQLIDDRTIDVTMTWSSPVSPDGETYEFSTTDGTVDFEGIPNDGTFRMYAEAEGYNSTSWTFTDQDKQHNVLMEPEDADIEFYNQTFALDDYSGEYPPSTTTIELEYFYLGSWQRQDIDQFGGENRATLKVEDGEDYRMIVWNTNGQHRVVGEYTADEVKADGIVTVEIQPIHEVGDGFGDENEDTTRDWDSEDDYNYPPRGSFSPSPHDPVVGESVTFDASSSRDLDGEIVAYDWEFSDGATASGKSVTHSFETEGQHSATLTVMDDEGMRDSETRSVWVAGEDAERRGPPDAVLEASPSEPNVSEVVQLDARASTSAEGEIEAYRWDIGDNGHVDGTGATFDHVFESSGFKYVCLEVEDDAGVTDRACMSIVVFDPHPPEDAADGRNGGGGGGFAGPTDTRSGGNPFIMGAIIAGAGVVIARRTGVMPSTSTMTGAAGKAASGAGRSLSGLFGSLAGLLRRFRR